MSRRVASESFDVPMVSIKVLSVLAHTFLVMCMGSR